MIEILVLKSGSILLQITSALDTKAAFCKLENFNCFSGAENHKIQKFCAKNANKTPTQDRRGAKKQKIKLCRSRRSIVFTVRFESGILIL